MKIEKKKGKVGSYYRVMRNGKVMISKKIKKEAEAFIEERKEIAHTVIMERLKALSVKERPIARERMRKIVPAMKANGSFLYANMEYSVIDQLIKALEE
jgi:MOSC domain-containing protein YiiM